MCVYMHMRIDIPAVYPVCDISIKQTIFKKYRVSIIFAVLNVQQPNPKVGHASGFQLFQLCTQFGFGLK